MSLIKNNAKVAAQIAVALANLQSEMKGGEGLHKVESNDNDIKLAAPVVIGGSILDVHYRVLDDNLKVSAKNFPHERFTSFSETKTIKTPTA